MTINERLSHELKLRASLDCLRKLTVKQDLADYCSNDYLGIATDNVLPQYADASVAPRSGSTGSRLLSGNSKLAEETEAAVAKALKGDAALIFGSGYDANVGLLSALGSRSTTVLFDELSHASVRDGLRLGFARSLKFRHNDLGDLEAKLSNASGETIVAVESVYSMDGDVAPLAEISRVCETHGAALIVDEAHATGVYGTEGEGACVAEGIETKVFARVHTFGKALGAHGGAVIGSELLRDYLVNFARSFIYATAPSAVFYSEIGAALISMRNSSQRRAALWRNIRVFGEEAAGVLDARILNQSPIFSIVIPGNAAVKAAARSLEMDGFDVRPILSPTVKVGSERLRISVHAHNTESELRKLAASLKQLFENRIVRA